MAVSEQGEAEGREADPWGWVYWGALGLSCGVEAVIIWHAVRDTPAGLLARSRVQGFLAKVASPCQHCREYRLARSRMHYHAYLHTRGLFEDDEGLIHDLQPDDAD